MNSRLRSAILLLGDYCIFFAALLVTILWLRGQELPPGSLLRHVQLFSGLFVVWTILFYIEGLYTLRALTLRSLPVSIVRALVFSILFSFIFFYLFPGPGITPKRNLILVALLAFSLSYPWHWFIRYILTTKRMVTRLGFFADERSVSLVQAELKTKPWLGFMNAQTLTNIEDLKPGEIDLLVVGREMMKHPKISRRLLELVAEEKNVMEIGRFAELVTGKIPLFAIDEAWFLEACGIQNSPLSRFAKNAVDKGVSLLLLLVVLPIYAVLIPALLVLSGRPLFFSQIRTGHLNKPFRIWKLRTMVVNAEKNGAQWAKPGDARVTPIGKILRMSRLDELPQLWNILSGDMSIVGPRPERPEIIESHLAPHIPFYEQRHLVRPGVTGWAQVNFRYGFSTDDALEKLQYDLYYVKNQSLWLDLRILLKTIKTVLTGAGQ